MKMNEVMSNIDIARAYFQAHNNQDLDAGLALIADDVIFEAIGSQKMRGKEALQMLGEWDAALNSHLSVSNFQERGNVVTCDVVEQNDWCHAAGIPELHYDICRIEVRDGKISRVATRLDAASNQALSHVLRQVINWAMVHRQRELHQLMPNGEFVYDPRYAPAWLALMNQWRVSQPAS